MKKKNHSPPNKLPALRSVAETKDLGNERDGSRHRGTRHVAQQQQYTVVSTILTVKVPIAMHFVNSNSSAAVSMWIGVWNALFRFGSVWFHSFRFGSVWFDSFSWIWLILFRFVLCVACVKVPVTLAERLQQIHNWVSRSHSQGYTYPYVHARQHLLLANSTQASG